MPVKGKDSELCERPFCIEKWTHRVGVKDSKNKKTYNVRLCEEHVAMYRKKQDKDPERKITIQERKKAK